MEKERAIKPTATEEKPSNLFNLFLFLQNKRKETENQLKSKRKEFARAIKENPSDKLLILALENMESDYNKFLGIIGDILQPTMEEPTEDKLSTYIRQHKSDLEGLEEKDKNNLFFSYAIIFEDILINIKTNIEKLKNIESENEDLIKIKSEILQYLEGGSEKESQEETENRGNNINIFESVKTDYFLLANNGLNHNLINSNLGENCEITDGKYKNNYILKTDEEIYNNIPKLTREDKLILDSINTLYETAEKKATENNNKIGFFIEDLFNLMNGGERESRKINNKELEKLENRLDFLRSIKIKWGATYYNGKELKGKDQEEQKLQELNGIEINQLLINFKSIKAIKKKDNRIKKEGIFYLFLDTPFILEIAKAQGKITRIDKRLLFQKQPNEKTRSLNSYLLDTLELMKKTEKKELIFNSLVKNLNWELKNKFQKRDLKNKIKQRLTEYKKINYIKNFKVKEDNFLITF